MIFFEWVPVDDDPFGNDRGRSLMKFTYVTP